MELVVIAIVVVVAILAALLYNGLVQARLAVLEGWSAVQVQLQRRGNLIPNLVETVRGYASHERATFDAVTQARARLLDASTPAAAAEANNQLTGALRSLFAVAEAYPDLKANQNFLDLQRQLADTEDKIAYARNFYNSRVLDYNGRIATVPGVVLAGPFGFRAAEFFKGEPEALAPVRVSFPELESVAPTPPTVKT